MTLAKQRAKPLLSCVAPRILDLLRVGSAAVCFILTSAVMKSQTPIASSNPVPIQSPPPFVVRCNAVERANEGSWLPEGWREDALARDRFEQSRKLVGIDGGKSGDLTITGSVTTPNGKTEDLSINLANGGEAMYKAGSTVVSMTSRKSMAESNDHKNIGLPYSSLLDVQILPLHGEVSLKEDTTVRFHKPRTGTPSTETQKTEELRVYTTDAPRESRAHGRLVYQTTVDLDPTTLLPTEERFCRPIPNHPYASIEVVRKYSNYKAVDGLQFPTHIEEFRGGVLWQTFSLTSVIQHPNNSPAN